MSRSLGVLVLLVRGEQVTAGRIQPQAYALAARGPGAGEDSGEPGAAWAALEQAVIGKAVDLLSGPGGLASFLRHRQLGAQGWTLVLNPDGTTTGWNKDKTRGLHSHGPPARPG